MVFSGFSSTFQAWRWVDGPEELFAWDHDPAGPREEATSTEQSKEVALRMRHASEKTFRRSRRNQR